MTDHVVVVGGTKGLGRVAAQLFQERGDTVTVLSRNAPAVWEGAAPLHHAIDLDMLTEEQAAAIAARICGEAGPVRYLVFSQRYRGSGDPWAGEIRVGVTATDLLIRAFADHFAVEGDRAIAAVGSVYSQFVGGSQPSAYHVAKAALGALVRHNACVMGRRGIRVNAIMPLTYLKPESRHVYLDNQALLDVYERFVPLGRMPEARECAEVIAFLCSRQASFVNGQSLFVDGGVSVVWPEEVARSFGGV